MRIFDVVIVGARCAGASAALLLARAGYRVLVLDRAKPGADTLSTLYIHQPGVARLGAWGVLDDVVATGCPPLDRPRYEVGDVVLQGPGPLAYAPRRHLLDAILAESASAAGAEIRYGCTVMDLVRGDDDAVTGLRYRDGSGAAGTVSCALVVGADGMRSTVARLVGAGEYAQHDKLSCAYYAYWSGVRTGFGQYQRDGQWVGTIPTNDDQVLIAAYFRQGEFDRVRATAANAYLDNLRGTAPAVFDLVSGGEQVGRLYGTGDQRNFLRDPVGAGWVLIGDAGHHKDSLTARGITDAFLQAQLLADCLGQAGERPLGDGLRAYRDQRDALLTTQYHATLAVARLDVESERLRMLRVVRDSPELTARYFAAAAGVVAPEEFYTPELLAS